ncbi:MAG TPA: hypothetical protein DEA26_01285 [Oceanospirillales bacterium]|nr:hypothetical protein [Oceanospirillaceae bacterium]HBS41283.1 hypothetical protein [Oceanospirillales bacterium]|tara:strand:- start:49 stop:1050 length:1002 start_codon:yes stop_codon:yes gene_type:complete
MGMAPIRYAYDDAGAPVLSDVTDCLYQILKACLVDGYGGKSAAGWSVVYDDWSGSGVFTITNALQTFVLGLKKFSGSIYGPGIFICEAMINASTPVNARSGRYYLSSLDDLTEAGEFQRGQFYNLPNAGQFVMYANDNAFHLFSGPTGDLFNSHNTDGDDICFWGSGAMFNAQGLADGDLGNGAVWVGNYRRYQSSSPGYTVMTDYSSNWHGTQFYSDGSAALSETWMQLQPFSQSTYNATINISGSRYLPLAPAMALSRSDNADIGIVPGLYSCPQIVSYQQSIARSVLRQYFDTSLQTLKDTIELGGKTFTACNLGWDIYGMISLEPEDWL